SGAQTLVSTIGDHLSTVQNFPNLRRVNVSPIRKSQISDEPALVEGSLVCTRGCVPHCGLDAWSESCPVREVAMVWEDALVEKFLEHAGKARNILGLARDDFHHDATRGWPPTATVCLASLAVSGRSAVRLLPWRCTQCFRIQGAPPRYSGNHVCQLLV